MVPQVDVLLVTKEDETAEIVSSVLHSSQRMSLASICYEMSELGGYLENTPIPAIVIDIDPDHTKILDDLDIIIAMYPEKRFIVVSSIFNNQLVLRAMQAGARYFMLKNSIKADLVDVLGRLTADITKREVALGSIISVFSASGGCGATTVAINLANELRLMSSESVLVVDLDDSYGAMSTYLGITGQYSIADVLTYKGLIDYHLIKSSAHNYKKDFHVLVNRAGFGGLASKSLQYQNLNRALEACTYAYRYTVIDAPRVSEKIAAELAAVSEKALVVFQLTVKDVKLAQLLVSSLTKSGFPPEKIIPLVNRFNKRNPLVRLEDGKKALGLDYLHYIRSDWRKAMNSANLGKPLSEVVPRSGLRRDFQNLAAFLTGIRWTNSYVKPKVFGVTEILEYVRGRLRNVWLRLKESESR